MGKKSREKRERVHEKPAAAARMDLRFPPALLGLLMVVAFLAYARTISFEFVFDDEVQILRNPWIRDWSNVLRFFSTDVWSFANTATTNYYRPLQMLIYAAGHGLSGLRPEAYHVLNLLLHALATAWVASIGFQLTGDRFASMAGGLIFAVHPVHAESVAWIAGVTDPLCAAFYFGALYFHLKDQPEPEKPHAWIPASGLFLGALLSKEMAFTFPVIAAWLDWCLYRKFRWGRYAAYAGVFAVYALMRIQALSSFFIQQVSIGMDFSGRALNSIILLAQYAVKMFVPFHINAYHIFEPVMSGFSARFALSLLALIILGAAAWLLRARKSILFLFGFSMLTLAPVLNITGIGENIFADRYLYIPSLGASLLIPLLAKEVWNRLPARIPLPGPRLAGIFLGLLLAVFSWMLWDVSGMWRDTPTLYLETMKRSPKATSIAANLGRYYFYRGEHDRAEEWFLKSLELWDQSFIKIAQRRATAYSGLGSIWYRRGDLQKAHDYFQKAYQDTPHDVSVLQNLGSVSAELGDFATALKYYEAALVENPRSEVTYSNLAAISLTMKDYDGAIRQARKAIDIFPNYGDAYMNLARAYAAKGMKQDAFRAYQRAKEVEPAKSAVVDADLRALEEPPGARK